MTHPTRAFSGSIINRFTGSKILARVGQISVAFPAFKKRVTRDYLLNELKISHDYWGFFQLTDEQFSAILKKGEIDENIIID